MLAIDPIDTGNRKHVQRFVRFPYRLYAHHAQWAPPLFIATIASQAFEYLDAPIERLGALDTPVPFNVDLMNAMLPSVDSIREKMEWLLRY